MQALSREGAPARLSESGACACGRFRKGGDGMRLWQKIFLLTLFLTALAASTISLLLLARNHRDALLLAKEKVQTVRDSAVAQIGHLIQEMTSQVAT